MLLRGEEDALSLGELMKSTQPVAILHCSHLRKKQEENFDMNHWQIILNLKCSQFLRASYKWAQIVGEIPVQNST